METDSDLVAEGRAKRVGQPSLAGRDASPTAKGAAKLVVMAILLVVLVVLVVVRLSESQAKPVAKVGANGSAMDRTQAPPLAAGERIPPTRDPQAPPSLAFRPAEDSGPIPRDPFVISGTLRRMMEEAARAERPPVATAPAPEPAPPATQPGPSSQAAPEAARPVSPADEFARHAAQWRLTGVLLDAERRLALINGRVLAPGDALGDYIVESIDLRSVTVRKDAFRGTISMTSPSATSQPSPPAARAQAETPAARPAPSQG